MTRTLGRTRTFVLTRTAGLALALVLGLGACSDLTGPDPSSPFDPDFAGSRIASPPTNLRAVTTTATSVTLAWTDGSSFDGGFRVEISDALDAGQYRTVAVVPADVFTYTYTTTDTRSFRFRVVALAPVGGQESRPGDTLQVAYRHVPADTVRIGVAFRGWPASQPQFSADGSQFFVGTNDGTRSALHAISVASGRAAWLFNEGYRVLGVLANDGVVTDDTADPSIVHVLTASGTTARDVTLAALSTACADFAVSADGLRAAAACAQGQMTVVSLVTGAVVSMPAEPIDRVVGLDPSGSRVYVVRPDRRLAAVEAETGRVLWSRPDVLQEPSVTVSEDGRQLLVAEASQIRVVNAGTGETAASRGTARPQRAAGFGGGFVAYADPADRDRINVDGKVNLVVARRADLGTVRSFFQAEPLTVRDRVLATATLGGAVGLVRLQSEVYGFVRWDATRALVSTPVRLPTGA